MLPNFLLGWNYESTSLGYGSGGYISYFQSHGALLPHWYLVILHVVAGGLAAAFGIYQVLRMRWRRFPKAWAIQNYHGLMIVTWILWFADALVGYAILYYFVLAGTG